MSAPASPEPSRLGRRLGLPAATVLALAAMLGAGIFAAWLPAYSYAGKWLLVALAFAAAIASLNAWSTTTLARQHPVAGGVYAYGGRWLGRWWGVAAGIAFIIGKTASAAGAALTFGAYIWPGHSRAIAGVVIAAVLVVDLAGVQRTVRVMAVFVAAIVLSLIPFLFSAIGKYSTSGGALPHVTLPSLLAATAILFVAFAGYARISTMGEEVREPKRTIPIATAIGLASVTVLLFVVGFVVVRTAPDLGTLHPNLLVQLAHYFRAPKAAFCLRVGAGVASVSVLLSLVVGLGRTIFAMSAGGDGIHALATVDDAKGVPRRAEMAAAVLVFCIAMFGTLGVAYAISGGAILIYYGIAHLSALRLGRANGGPPRLVPIIGVIGVVVIVAGLLIAQIQAN